MKKSQLLALGAFLGVGMGVTPFSAGFCATVNAYTPCLDYGHVGPSNCSTPVTLPPKVATQTPSSTTLVVTASPTVPHTPTMDEKIDEFLKNQGKPPREFVAFYLNPTPENALKWANTFKEIQTRNQQITEAWTQAEQYVDKVKNSGGDTSKFVSTTLPPVMPVTGPLLDWNNPEAFYAELASSTAPGGQKTNVSNTVSALSGLDSNPTLSIGGTPALSVTPPALLQAAREGAKAPMRISYYFSATCEYCKKFTPELQTVLQHLGGNVQTECVDLTSATATSTPQPGNIEGQVDCTWRQPNPGEVQSMGIKTTPSLIVHRPGSAAAERINGYVEGAKLEKWLKTGKTE